MLFYSLFLATFLLAMANLSSRHGNGWKVGFVICGCCFTCGGGVIYPVGALLLILLSLHPYSKRAVRRRKYFPVLSLAAASLVFVLAGGYAWHSLSDYEAMRAEFPFESMEDRLPAIEPIAESSPLTDDSAQRLDQLERFVEQHEWRRKQLEWLHGDQVNLFINSPGFGVIRMHTHPKRVNLLDPNADLSIPQPFETTERDASAASEVWKHETANAIQFQLHQASALDFVNPRGFGYFKDRQRVAGFQSHRFTEVPRSASKPSVNSIDLVSLILHEKPVAYVSDELPRMDKLRRRPTRPLSEFESSGLTKLRSGEDLVVESFSSKMRMLGSIRSTKQCLDCHGGQRGDLLGAFSYTLK